MTYTIKTINHWRKKSMTILRRWKFIPCSWIGRINSENGYITKNHLVQFNLHQNSNDILHRDRKIIVIVIKAAWCWHKNKHEDRWNRVYIPNTNLHSYSHLILTKELKTCIGEKITSSVHSAGKTGYSHIEDWN
jgi:hypothetical protein